MALEMRRARFGRTGSSHSSSPPCVKGPASAEGGPLHVGAVLLGPFGHAAWVPSRLVAAVTSRFPERGYNLLRGQEFSQFRTTRGKRHVSYGIRSLIHRLVRGGSGDRRAACRASHVRAGGPQRRTSLGHDEDRVRPSLDGQRMAAGRLRQPRVGTRGQQLFRLGHQLRLGAGRHRRLDRHRALVDVVPWPLGGDIHDCALRECRDQLQLRAFAREPGWREHHRHVQVLLPQQLCRRQPCRRRAGDRQQPAQRQ